MIITIRLCMSFGLIVVLPNSQLQVVTVHVCKFCIIIHIIAIMKLS